MPRATSLGIVALAACAAKVLAEGPGLVRVPVTIVDPPNGSFVGGGLLELGVAPHAALSADAAWTLCVRGGEGGNTSCIACGPAADAPRGSACLISASVDRAGPTTASVWAVLGTDATVPQLSALVLGPASTTTTLGVLAMTPREVVALPASAEARAAPPSTSQSWWGRSTREAVAEAVRAAEEQVRAAREADAQDGKHGGSSAIAGDDGHGALPAQFATSAVPVPASVPRPAPLSLRRHRTFLGPDLAAEAEEAARLEREIAAEEAGAPAPLASSLPVLVAVAAGARGAAVVNETLWRLHSALSRTRGLDVLVLAYDATDWDAVAAGGAAGGVAGTWAEDATVVRRRGHMKWWLVKRFLHPDLASSGAYGWVLILDEDAALGPRFSPEAFFRSLERHGVLIGQPLHADASNTSFPFLQRGHARALVALEGYKWRGDNTLEGAPTGRSGREEGTSAAVLWTTMVECGPVTAFDAQAVWPCVWGLLEPDLASGFGYDLLWASACAAGNQGAAVAGEDGSAGSGGKAAVGPAARAGVVLSQELRHVDLGTASGERAGFFRRSVAEALVLFERRRRDAGQDVADGGPMTPGRAMASLRLALRSGAEAAAFPEEPRVVGVGWEAAT